MSHFKNTLFVMHSSLRSALLLLTFLLSATVAAEELFVTSVAKGKSVNSPAKELTFYPAQRVEVLRKRGANALIRADGGDEFWVPLMSLASASEFRPIDIWQGPKTFRLGEGDYSASYRFEADGTFKVTKLTQVSDNSTRGYNYKHIQYSGKLFLKGEAVWARDNSARMSAETMFWLVPSRLCSHISGLCPP